MFDLYFLNQNVFYMMLLPLIVLTALLVTNKDNMERHFSKSILKELEVNSGKLGKNARNILFVITLILFIISLARPVVDQKEQNIKQNLIPIVIALDVSKSMKAKDIYPNRITLAKNKLKQIIDLSQNSTIGIVLFAKDSFILSPVTEDFISLKYIVENLNTDLEFVNGSNIYAVLEATSQMLKDFKAKNLIILSDGGNNDTYEEEITFAKENGITVYTVGIATKNGSPIPSANGYLTDREGKIVTVSLNESIKKLALDTNGGYIDYTLNSSDIDAVIDQINKSSKREQLQTQKIKIYTELFYYPLGLAIFTLLLAISSFPSRKNKAFAKTSAAALLCIIPVSDLKAFEFDFQKIEKANDYYNKGQFAEASKEYGKVSKSPQSLYNKANSLYKAKKYDEAVKYYNQIVTTDKDLEYKKLHNIGNSYVKKNDLQKAKEFYEKA